MFCRTLNNIYGQIRGYNRSQIRRAVDGASMLSRDELMAQSKALLQRRVVDAVKRFPLYAEKMRKAIGSIPQSSDEVVSIEKLPVWTRKDQNELFSGISGKAMPSDYFAHSTGGSSGQPMRFYVSRESYEWRTAVSDRGYSWANAEEGRNSFYVWGASIKEPTTAQKLKQSMHHMLQKRFFFNSFDFNDERKSQCCSLIDARKPPVIIGYAGNLVELARFVRDNKNILRWKALNLITAAEGLQGGQRELLQEYLADNVFLSYGSREFMLIGMECECHTGYHINLDNLMLEVVDDAGMPCDKGVTGRILITDLHNSATPFIRYEIGDLGAWSKESCPCGRPFPLLASVDGRIQEVIYTDRGEKLTALFIPHLMKEFSWIEGYQLRQVNHKELTVNLLTQDSIFPTRTDPIRNALKVKLGESIKIVFRKVDSLEKTASGKVSIVIHDQ